jgi:hypothetical protein
MTLFDEGPGNKYCDIVGAVVCLLFIAAAMMLVLALIGCAPYPTIYRTESGGQTGTATPVQGYDGVVTVAHAVDGGVALHSLDGEVENVPAQNVRKDQDFAHVQVKVIDGHEYPLCDYHPQLGEMVTVYRWSAPASWDAGPFVVYENRIVTAFNGEHVLLDQEIPAGSSGAPALSESGCIIGFVTSITPLGETRLIRANVATEFLEE